MMLFDSLKAMLLSATAGKAPAGTAVAGGDFAAMMTEATTGLSTEPALPMSPAVPVAGEPEEAHRVPVALPTFPTVAPDAVPPLDMASSHEHGEVDAGTVPTMQGETPPHDRYQRADAVRAMPDGQHHVVPAAKELKTDRPSTAPVFTTISTPEPLPTKLRDAPPVASRTPAHSQYRAVEFAPATADMHNDAAPVTTNLEAAEPAAAPVTQTLSMSEPPVPPRIVPPARLRDVGDMDSSAASDTGLVSQMKPVPQVTSDDRGEVMPLRSRPEQQPMAAATSQQILPDLPATAPVAAVSDMTPAIEDTPGLKAYPATPHAGLPNAHASPEATTRPTSAAQVVHGSPLAPSGLQAVGAPTPDSLAATVAPEPARQPVAQADPTYAAPSPPAAKAMGSAMQGDPPAIVQAEAQSQPGANAAPMPVAPSMLSARAVPSAILTPVDNHHAFAPEGDATLPEEGKDATTDQKQSVDPIDIVAPSASAPSPMAITADVSTQPPPPASVEARAPDAQTRFVAPAALPPSQPHKDPATSLQGDALPTAQPLPTPQPGSSPTAAKVISPSPSEMSETIAVPPLALNSAASRGQGVQPIAPPAAPAVQSVAQAPMPLQHAMLSPAEAETTAGVARPAGEPSNSLLVDASVKGQSAPPRFEALSLLQWARDLAPQRPASSGPTKTEPVFRAAEGGVSSPASEQLATPPVQAVTAIQSPPSPAIQMPVSIAPAIDVAATIGATVVDMGVGGQWLDRLARDIAGFVANGPQGSFRIDAGTLGPVEVAIARSGEGAVISLHVASDAAEAALRQDGDRLRQDAALSSVRIAEVRIERTPLADAPRGDATARDTGQHHNPADQQGGAMGQQGAGQSAGRQGRDNNGFLPKAASERAVMDDGQARDRADAAPRARYA